MWMLFFLARSTEKDIAFKSERHYQIPAIFRFATQPYPTLSMTSIILTLYFFNLRLIPYIPTMPFQKTILCYNSKGREIIVKAYHDYPNDYRIMHYYMWNIGGDMADNNPTVLIEYKEEFLSICEKILDGCTEDALRLGAWNMRAKILHAEGKTDEALRIYQTKFADWYTTNGQKTEQLFAKDTEEYYFHVRKNMYELGDFAADKLWRTVFFDPSRSLAEKVERAILYGDLMLNAYRGTQEAFFLMLAGSFLGRMENDLYYRGGTDEQIIAVMDRELHAKKLLEEVRVDLFFRYFTCTYPEQPYIRDFSEARRVCHR